MVGTKPMRKPSRRQPAMVARSSSSRVMVWIKWVAWLAAGFPARESAGLGC
jgi:hypothetical protein